MAVRELTGGCWEAWQRRFYAVRLTRCFWLEPKPRPRRKERATLKSIVVPLDGSEVAESVLPAVLEMAKKLNIEIVLFRAFNVPYSVVGGVRDHIAIVR